MPLYEYECFVCKHHFERIRRVDDDSPVTCPRCEGEVRRLLSAPALQFKGSGWYVTDYGRGNGSRASALAKSDDSPTTDSTPKAAPAKDAKAEKKASTS